MKNLQEKLLAAFQVEHKDHLAAARGLLDAGEAASWSRGAFDLIELHRRLHSLKGAARAVDMPPVEKLAHALEGLIEDCQKGSLDLGADAAGAARQALDLIEDCVEAAMARRAPPAVDAVIGALEGARRARRETPRGETAPSAEAADIPARGASPAAVEAGGLTRIETRSFDALVRCSSEILAAVGSQDDMFSEIKALQDEVRALETSVAGLRRSVSSGPEESGWSARTTDRVEDPNVRLRRMERVLSSAERRQRAHSWQVRRLGRSLQTQVRLLQTISAEGVFEGARKIVRDIALEQGKSVRTTVRGLETLADRTVLQSLKDPVLHLLRNAVHHGIEAPGERRRRGKPEEGTVLFDIAARGSEIVVTVEDDGRGVDRERVVRIARERGLIDAAAAGEIGEQEMTLLLAEPGLSTAMEVSAVAGRGIGLSVVKEAVTRLGGALAISARTPYGTRVVLTAPSSALSMRFLLIRIGRASVCIPANRTVRIHRLARNRIESIDGRAHAMAEGEPPMAVAPLAFLINGGEGELQQGEGGQLLVIELTNADGRFGVVVDDVVGVRDGVMRDLGFEADQAGAAAGAVILEDGALAPVLDVAELFAAYKRAGSRCALPPAQQSKRARQPSVLVVDDSITTRTLEKSVLEANGYHVRLSVDGADALNQLRRYGADLVISDIEMPTLDGFGLLSAMKQDPALSRIPTILVTSRSDDTDRRRGLQLGADAYVVKQRFDQLELLTIIGRLL